MDITAKNTKRWSILGPRATYGMAMLDLVENDENVYVLSGDLGISSGLSRLMAAHPDRFLNAGIAEQNLISVSAGLAKEGLVPFASSFAPFITHRCADQVRMNMGYMHLNVKTVALGSGISMGTAGNSHYGPDDFSFMRTIPGMTILSPCDCAEVVKCVEAAAKHDGPVYIRLTGEAGMPRVYEDDFEFEIGKANKLAEGSDVIVLATGSMVYNSLEAAKILTESGISASVYDVHTVKPLDVSMLENLPGSTKLIVTVEEHGTTGGLGAAVCQYTAQKGGMPKVVNIGLPQEYLLSGSYQYMLDRYGLTAEKIAQRIKDAI